MLTCPNCGAENREAARFCEACGRPAALAEAAEPFRKTVTVLFSDVVGSTSLGEQLDPEALSQVMTEYFDAMRPIVERHGGTLAKFVGDAVLAVFGIPTLHEDDALRAVRAAVEMRTELGRLNGELERRFGLTLSTRAGVNTGPVGSASSPTTISSRVTRQTLRRDSSSSRKAARSCSARAPMASSTTPRMPSCCRR